MSFMSHFCLALCSFGRSSSALVGYHMKRGGMPLRDDCMENCKMGATTENQGSGVMYMGKGVYLDDCVFVI